MAKLSTTAQADFDLSDEASAVLIIDEEPIDPIAARPPYGEAWIRVWSTAGVPTLTSTSGNGVYIVNNGVTLEITETVAFNKDSTASLSRPPLEVGTWTVIGSFIGATGGRIPAPNLVFDLERSEIVSSVKCFGSVSVTYTTKFSRYRCAFAKDPNATDGDTTTTPPTPPSESEYSPMLIVAARGTLTESLNLSAPRRPSTGSSVLGTFPTNESSGGTPYKLELIEVGFTAIGGLGALRAHVWAYVGNATSIVTASTGNVEEYKFGAGMHSPATTEHPVIESEVLVWTDSTSAVCKYPPVSTINIITEQKGTRFVAKHYGEFAPIFLSGEGRVVSPMVFRGYKNYTAGDTKVLKLGEVVTLASSMAIASTGSVKVTYRARRRMWTVYWGGYTDTGPWYPPVYLSLTDTFGSQTASLMIEPPTRNGRL